MSWDWHPSIILGIAKAAGNPVRIDERSLAGDYGHYVRVLVEVDLSLPIQEQVMIERTGHFRFLSLFYEWLQPYCSHCNVIGRWKQRPREAVDGNRRGGSRERSRSRMDDNITNVVVLVISREKDTSKGKVQVADSSPVSTSNSFSADSNSDLEKVAEIDKMPQAK